MWTPGELNGAVLLFFLASLPRVITISDSYKHKTNRVLGSLTHTRTLHINMCIYIYIDVYKCMNVWISIYLIIKYIILALKKFTVLKDGDKYVQVLW